jgi:hypothetical protein
MRFYQQAGITLAAGTKFVYGGDGQTMWAWFKALKMAGQNILIQFDQRSPIPLRRSSKITIAFQSFTLINADASANAQFNLMIGDADVDYETPQDQTPDAVAASVADTVVGAGATVDISNGSMSNVAYLISVPASATGPLRFGDANTGAASGVFVYPGQQPYRLMCNGALYAYNPTGAAVAVALVIEKT